MGNANCKTKKERIRDVAVAKARHFCSKLQNLDSGSLFIERANSVNRVYQDEYREKVFMKDGRSQCTIIPVKDFEREWISANSEVIYCLEVQPDKCESVV